MISVRFRALSMLADLQVTDKPMDIVITVRPLSVLSVCLSVSLSVSCHLLSRSSCPSYCMWNPSVPSCLIILLHVLSICPALEPQSWRHKFSALCLMHVSSIYWYPVLSFLLVLLHVLSVSSCPALVTNPSELFICLVLTCTTCPSCCMSNPFCSVCAGVAHLRPTARWVWAETLFSALSLP